MNKAIAPIFVFFVFFALFLKPVLAGQPLHDSELKSLQLRTVQENIICEAYMDTNRGKCQVFGYHFDTFITNEAFYTLAIAGAVGGQIGGYGMAGFGIGYKMPVTDIFSITIKALIGSGGGGGISAGGGLVNEILCGTNFQVSDQLSLMVSSGILAFPYGDMSTSVFQAGIQIKTYSPVLSQDH